ncbi:hypothetical protein NOF04DRAFT_19283 [Fusarium oxysporum II5]|uniref:Zn(2)-C6 fungal-type domain-containing protein n=1 Tax=Fusarium odoratissimum (strain NRRL 54006) TaxID=1089451 RepID=X0J3L8_FUSO5|nr:uncharacterized protein FOIG_15851 [Fusarium odoratissimum NRRL 54006]EXL90951.1 hypothetical protein FOIG_15851 [Fusarium odoratissimum NRRL 54006]KAK2123320.1 hypothetical protein NOF04DRAFT_19283 [Fusarium oxysporum II5]
MKRQEPCEPSQDSQPSIKRGPSRRPPRASQACRSCAASKVRCDDLERCRRCLKRGVACVRPTQVAQCHQTILVEPLRAPSDSSTSISVDTEDSCILELTAPKPSGTAPIAVPTEEDGGGLIMGDSDATIGFAFPNSPLSLGHPGSSQVGQVIFPQGGQYAERSQPRGDMQPEDNLGDILPADTTEWLKNAPLHAEFDQSLLFPFSLIDFSGFSEAIQMHDSTDLADITSKTLQPQDKTVFEEAVIAYNTTLGGWKPTPEDYVAAARASLYVPLEEQARLLEDLCHFNPVVIDTCLSAERREDIMLAMIDGTQTAHSLLAVRMFPSAEILDKLLKAFLSTQETSALAFIHLSTFDPSTCSLHLLIACIVAGAALSQSPSARKFGLALLDVLRLHLAASAERDNTLTRDISYVQSLMILSETGLWSGDKRISEMSDILSGLAASMLRHGGRFAQHAYLNPGLMLEEPRGDLDEAWRSWAEQESLKRTVHRHLLQCTQRSVIRNMPAQICPLEVTTPIPEDCRFWFAKSAIEWRSIYLDSQPQQPFGEPRMSISDCLSDIQSIDRLPSSQSSKSAQLSMLYSFLSMLVDDRRRSVLFHKQRDSGWSFTDVTRSDNHSDLVYLFKELRDVIEKDPIATRSVHVTFMVEFNILYSATPRYLRDFLLTDGKQAPAPEAFSQLHEWQQSRASRSAIWHAGQLMRACREIEPKERTDFHLLGVYRALLCLWTYWTATRKNSPTMTDINRYADSSPQVLLDGHESLESQRWISHNNGAPYLARPPQSSELRDMVPDLVPVDAIDSGGNLFKLPLVGLLNECFSFKTTGRHIPILQHASLILCSLERL